MKTLRSSISKNFDSPSMLTSCAERASAHRRPVFFILLSKLDAAVVKNAGEITKKQRRKKTMARALQKAAIRIVRFSKSASRRDYSIQYLNNARHLSLELFTSRNFRLLALSIVVLSCRGMLM